MTERDVMEFDVVIVGGGPSGMATAIHLKNLIERHNAEVEKTGQGQPIPGEVVLIEKAAEIGTHSISGAVMDPKGLDALIPEWRTMEPKAPVEAEVHDDYAIWLTENGGFKFPVTPPPLKNHGNFVISLNKMVKWLGSIAEELMRCTLDNMNLDQWVAINVVPETMYADQLTTQLQQAHKRINAEILSDASAGVRWGVTIDIESMSPVSEEEKFQKWMQGLTLFANPPMARLFSVSPELLIHTLDLLGMKSSKDQQLIVGAMQQVVAMEQQLAAQSQNASPGISGQPNAGPPKPKPGGPPGPGPKPGGPQPGAPAPPTAPTGPGASPPKVM
jgi:hypothetical protein